MYHPIVGERVWLSGCPEQFIVQRADYSASVAAITLTSNGETTASQFTPFRLLFAEWDFEAAQDGAASERAVRGVLCSSEQCVRGSAVFIRDIRETIRATLDSVRKSRTLIEQSDRTVARWQSLGCEDRAK